MTDRHIERVLNELDLAHEVLPADGHNEALERAIAFVTTRLAGGSG